MVQVMDFTVVVAVTAGGVEEHSLALKPHGTLWAWGFGEDGQLGDGTATTRLSPVRIGTSTDWTVAAAGGYHTVALKSDGTLWAWGMNQAGQLGDAAIDLLARSPVRIGTGTNWTRVTAVALHTGALT